MKRLVVLPILFSALGLGLAGCSEKETLKTESKTTSPGGTTKVTQETTVEKTGKNPPPATP